MSVDGAAAKFAGDVSAIAIGFLKALHRSAAALNMSEAIKHLDDVERFAEIRAQQLEVQFRDVLERQVLQAGALSTADLLGTQPCDPSASAWSQYVRSQGAPDLAAGIDAVVYVWGEKVTRYWDDNVQKRASIKVRVPGDAALAAFAMMQCAVRDLVWRSPWIVASIETDDTHFRRALVNGLVESCVTVQGDLGKSALRSVLRQLARPLLPGYVERAPEPSPTQELDVFAAPEEPEETTEPEAESEAEPVPEAESELEAQSEPEADAQSEPEADAQVDPEREAEPVPEAESEPETDTFPDLEYPDAGRDAVPETFAAPVPSAAVEVAAVPDIPPEATEATEATVRDADETYVDPEIEDAIARHMYRSRDDLNMSAYV